MEQTCLRIGKWFALSIFYVGKHDAMILTMLNIA